MKKMNQQRLRVSKLPKWALFILAVIMASVIKATEVYVCEWVDEVYGCYLISEPEKKKEEAPLIFEIPDLEEPIVYEY